MFYDFERLPQLNRALVHDLAAGRYLQEKAPVLIVGNCGTGKSHLAQALGHCAVRQGVDVVFTTCASLTHSLNAARATGSYERELATLARVPLLNIDDFGLKLLRAPADEYLYDLIVERYEQATTIVTSKLDFTEWERADVHWPRKLYEYTSRLTRPGSGQSPLKPANRGGIAQSGRASNIFRYTPPEVLVGTRKKHEEDVGMIRRFRLEQKSHYERLVVAQRLSDMLSKFLDGRCAPLGIGAEQGGIEEWDDVVVLHSQAEFEHLQVKRQASDFCTKNPDKTKHRTKPSKGADPTAEPAESVLDSAFSSLARHAGLGTFNELPDRRFQLTLVGAHLKIKNDLTVNHLDELCKLCRQDGLDLNQIASRNDGPTQRAYLWLTTWCGFKDWSQIRDTLRRVTIVCVGNDATLEQRSTEALSRHFADPKRALERLVSYMTRETSDVSALGCHGVVRELKGELRPDIETWAQYLLGEEVMPAGRTWSFAGTHDLGGVHSRSAPGVVAHMWGNEPGCRRLRVYAPYTAPSGPNLSLSTAILRMALHLPNGSQSLMLGEAAWRISVGQEVGHTLGCAESDLKSLPWTENPEPLACALDRQLTTQGLVRQEAEELASAMDSLVWERLVEGVAHKLAAISDPALADAMEAIWIKWVGEFQRRPESRREFLDPLLYPTSEGKNAKHALRLGPRTLDLLVTAVETLLLLAAGIDGKDQDWTSFPDCGRVQSIALKYWSGPVGGAPEVRELSDDPLRVVIGPSPAPVVVLSGVSASPSELLNLGIADDVEAATSMAAERQPYLLVTRSGAFAHLRKGNLASVRQHFTKQWNDRMHARESAIERSSKGL